MQIARRRSAALTLALVLTIAPLTATQTACGGEKELKAAAEAAKDIGGGTRDVIDAVGKAYTQGLIDIKQKDRLADILKKISQGGQKGVNAIAALEAARVKTLSGEQKVALTKIFDAEVIAPFLDLLTEIGKLTDQQSAAIRIALASVRTAILLFSNKIGRNDVEIEILRREVQHA